MNGAGGAANEPAEVRGFAVYVGIDEFHALAEGTTLSEMATELKALVQRIAPSAQTYTSVAVAPSDSGGRDIDVVKRSSRLAALDNLRSPGATPAAASSLNSGADDEAPVIIDLSRRRMVIDREVKLLTYMEFELLQYLVENEGVAVSRAELTGVLWSEDEGGQMSSRTIDVHVRRLRVKLGAEADLVRTVHGVGYVFNGGSNVRIRYRNEIGQ